MSPRASAVKRSLVCLHPFLLVTPDPHTVSFSSAETKTWQYYELSGYEYLSYNQLFDKVKTASNGLRALGLDHSTNFNIYAQTR